MSLLTFENMPTTQGNRQSNSVVEYDMRDNLLANLHDAIAAAWIGWETACEFQDEELKEYYMNYVTSCSDMMKKVTKF